MKENTKRIMLFVIGVLSGGLFMTGINGVTITDKIIFITGLIGVAFSTFFFVKNEMKKESDNK
jgi:hypothetical protein